MSAASAKVNGHSHPVTTEVTSPSAVTTQRMRRAGAKAMQAHQHVAAKAASLIEEIDDLTPVYSPRPKLTQEDSVVTTIEAVIAAHIEQAPGTKEG